VHQVILHDLVHNHIFEHMKQCRHLVVLIIATATLYGCMDTRTEKNENLSELIPVYLSYAEHPDTPVARRLYYARFSDSVAWKHHLKGRGDILRVLALANLAAGDEEQALECFKAAAAYAKRHDNHQLQGLSLNNIGAIYHRQAQYDSALPYYDEALTVFDSSMQAYRAMTMVNTGIIYKEKGQYDMALRRLLWGASILDSIDDNTNLGYAYNSIANVFNEIGSFEKALNYHKKALDIRKAISDTVGIAGTLNNIGNTYKYLKAYDKALSYYIRSLKEKRRIGDAASTAVTLNNIAAVQFSLGRYKEAEKFYHGALEIRTKREDVDGTMTTANGLTELYLATNELAQAKKTAIRTLENGMGPGAGLLRQRLRNYLLLVDIATAEGSDKQALGYAIKAHELKDSIFSRDMALAVSEMEARYRTKEQEVELLSVKHKEALQSKKLIRQKNYIFFLSVAALLLLIISYLVFRLSEQRKRAKERNEVLLHELNHRVKNNLQIITDVLQLQIAGAHNTLQKETLQSIRGKVHSINMVHKLLLDTGYSQVVNTKEFVHELSRHLFSMFEHWSVQFNVSLKIDDFGLSINQAIPLGLILNELLTNIYKHHPTAEGMTNLDIRLLEQNNEVKLTIMTHPSSWDYSQVPAGKGTGLFLVEILAKQLKGNFNIYNDKPTLYQVLSFERAINKYGNKENTDR